MRERRTKSALERGSAADLWRNTLSRIPTAYGRLVYLSSLRDRDTGRYEHHGLAAIFGEHEAEQALRQSHEDVFKEWLSYDLEQQKADLDLYVSQLTVPKRTVVETWARVSPHRNMIPAGTPELERDLYLLDIETLLELLKNEYDVAGPDRDA